MSINDRLDYRLRHCWVTPAGQCFIVPDYGHNHFIEIAFCQEVKERDIELRGWIKISNGNMHCCINKITRKQKQWLIKNNFEPNDVKYVEDWKYELSKQSGNVTAYPNELWPY